MSSVGCQVWNVAKGECRKGGIQDWRDSGNGGDRKRGFMKGGMRTGEMLERRDVGQEGCWEVGMKDWRDAGREGLRKLRK